MTDDLNVLTREVEQYILRKTGKRVYIVFNNIQRFAVHLEMLQMAYKYIKENR
jgi:hypothetical protein